MCEDFPGYQQYLASFLLLCIKFGYVRVFAELGAIFVDRGTFYNYCRQVRRFRIK